MTDPEAAEVSEVADATTQPGGLLHRLRSPRGLGGAAVVLAVVLIGVGLLRPPGRIDVFLESAGAVGVDPFMTLDGVVELRIGAELLLELPGGITLRVGTEPGLYGGSGSDQVCDPALIAAFLADDVEKAGAWAEAQGITIDEIPEYLASLTPVVLLADTWVTNHGFRDGRATPRQSVLQAGSMVLVDDTGVPRVRCKCGNPLAEPQVPDDLDRVDFIGTPWGSGDEDGILVIEPGDRVDAFILVRLEDGRLVARPVGTTGDEDVLLDEDGNWIPELDLGLPEEAAPDDGPFAIPTENSAGIPVEYAFDGPCSRRDDELVLDGSGRCLVDATTEAEAPWAALAVQYEIVIGLRPQEIVFAPFDHLVVGEDPSAIAAESDSLLGVSYSVGGPCELVDGAITASSAGTCTLTIAQAGDDVWAPAEPVVADIDAIEGDPRAPGDLVLELPPTMRLSDEPLPLAATSSSERTIVYLAAGACDAVDGMLVPAAVGRCVTVAALVDDDDDQRATSTAVVEIERRLQTIGLDLLPELAAPSDPALPLPATSSAGFDVVYAATGPCEVGSEGLSFTGEGACELTGSADGDDETEPVTETRSITVDDGVSNRQAQTISFSQPGSLVFGGGSVRLRASATSGLPVAFTVTGGSCRLSGTTLRPGNAGTCTIAASQNGSVEWEPGRSVTRSVTVAKARPSISISAAGSMAANGSQPVRATASSGPGAVVSVVGGPCSLSGGSIVASGAGTCSLRAATPGDANHEPVATSFSVQISLATQSISFTSAPGSLAIGNTAPVAAAATSGLPVSLTAGPGGVCTLSGGTLSAVGEGACSLSANQGGSSVFSPAPSVGATVQIVKQAHTITISLTASSLFVNQSADWSAVSSAGLAPTVTTSGAACAFRASGASGTVVGRSPGTCTITASHPGTSTVAAASATATVTVSKRTDSVTVSARDFEVFGESPVGVSTTSGLPFTISASGACVLDGPFAFFASQPGPCTISASTAGNAEWEPASGSITINVVPATPRLSIAMPSFATVGGFVSYTVTTDAPNVSVSVSGPCTIVVSGASGRISADGVGTCTLTATVSGGVFATRSGSASVQLDLLG